MPLRFVLKKYLEVRKMANDTLAIVVTYNRKNLLKECIQHLKSLDVPCDVLIVDNASTDGTSSYIADELNDNISYVNTGSNLGGAGGFNYALKKAYNTKYKYLWLMDDDTMVHKDSLTELLKAAHSLDDDFGFLSSFGLFTDGKPCKMNVQKVTTKWTDGITSYNYLLKTEKATFVSLFIKRSIIGKIGLPVKEFFIWADDSEYTTRISKQFRSYTVLNSKITHKMVSNADAGLQAFLNEETERYQRFYYSFRNRFYIAKRDGISNIIFYLARLIAISSVTLFRAKKFRFNKFMIVLKGLFDGIFFNPKVEFPNQEGE